MRWKPFVTVTRHTREIAEMEHVINDCDRKIRQLHTALDVAMGLLLEVHECGDESYSKTDLSERIAALFEEG